MAWEYLQANEERQRRAIEAYYRKWTWILAGLAVVNVLLGLLNIYATTLDIPLWLKFINGGLAIFCFYTAGGVTANLHELRRERARG